MSTPSPLDRYCIVELKFWRDNLRRANSRDVCNCNPLFISVYSDANDITCGGHILRKDIFAHRMFTNVERTQSESTYPFCFGYIEPLSFQFPGKMVYRQPTGG